MVHPKLKIKYDGRLVTVNEMARILGLFPATIWHRLEQGYPKEKLLSRDRYTRGGNVRGTPFLAAAYGELTGDEYLAEEKARNLR